MNVYGLFLGQLQRKSFFLWSRNKRKIWHFFCSDRHLCHESAAVIKGCNYVLRSDVMYPGLG